MVATSIRTELVLNASNFETVLGADDAGFFVEIGKRELVSHFNIKTATIWSNIYVLSMPAGILLT